MIVVAPTAFKEALGPVAAARAIASGLKSNLKKKQIELYPLSDGGDGFLECIAYYLRGKRLKNTAFQVTGPAGERIRTSALICGKQAFIESASILGLRLLDKTKRDPLNTTSRGLGEAILTLLDKDMEEVVVGLGGSATVDGGRAALEVLGVRFLDSRGELLPEGPHLARLDQIDLSGIDPRVKRKVLILWDVDNPLLGPYGAMIYTPQKGAEPKDLKVLAEGLERYAELAELSIAQRLDHRRGMGAAGGIAFGFAALAGCKTMSGADYMLRLSGLRERLRKDDIVISGEGRLDKQSLSYKVIGALRKLPHSKLILLCGEVAVQIAPRDRRTTAISIQPGPIDHEQAIANTKEYLKQTATQIGRLLK